jgi:thioredoxin-like negative regulator of GroEL
MIELASSTCQPCNAFDPILLELQKEGFPITRIDTDKTKTNYTVKATPSFVMLMDGKEVGRVEGSLSKIKITEWYNAVLIWSKKQP